ncbi:MAG TPA: nucleotide sugar dehydrogenase [Hyphomonas sp.]|mgnify:CR=1 FL=1|jgi:GDP-mannose 6-dehydrogenase|nr:nucleotide sugar dehydrogenase [Geminicoccaceae bacterium]HRX72903.1 nucleotide sugar dehydrogenase [Hyphomonas sp.]
MMGRTTLHIAILGLGYVGTTTAACLLKDGHHVYGIDINPAKVEMIGAGRSPVVEPEVEPLLQAGLVAGRLASGPSLEPWLDRLDLVLICVGTPCRADGKLEMVHLLEVTRQLGCQLQKRRGTAPLLLVFRSTMAPGTMERLVLPTLATAAGESPGRLYEVAFNPEFLRESTAVKDYYNPPKIVVGEREPGVSRRLLGIYDGLDAPFFEVGFAAAEMVKFVDNCFHALKVAFANEIGRIALAKHIDPQIVADIFLADTKLNVSAAYLRPGGPFGGSCLPKDLGAMLALAREAGVQVPVLGGTRESNAVHAAWLAQAVQARLAPPGPILLMGLSFKAETDDLRNSPLLELAEALLDAGYDLRVFDPDLDPNRLVGVNFALAAEHQEVLRSCLTRDLAAAAAGAGLIVLGKPMPEHQAALPAAVPRLDIPRLRGFDG